MQRKPRKFRLIGPTLNELMRVRGFVHKPIPTLTTTYPQTLAAVSLVSWNARRKLVPTVERSEGHWRQSLFKRECREDPRRGRGQHQAVLAQGISPCAGSRWPTCWTGQAIRVADHAAPQRCAPLRRWVVRKAAPARERGANLGENLTVGPVPTSRRPISQLGAT